MRLADIAWLGGAAVLGALAATVTLSVWGLARAKRDAADHVGPDVTTYR